MKVCKHCGEINSNDSEFCCNCGKDKFIYQEELICPHCGALNDKSFGHCINCGNSLEVTTAAHAPQVTSDVEGYTPVPVDLREELSEVYGGMSKVTPSETAKCPKCGAIVPLTAIFCQKCGESVASLHEHRVVQRKVCPHCGGLNSLEAHFCSYCFCSLADAATEDLQVVHESQNLGDITVRQSFLEGFNCKKLICPNCGALNATTEAFCVNCGLKLEVESPKKYCPNCGAENPFDSSFCAKCQWSFEGTSPDAIDKWTCANCEHTNEKEDEFCSHCGQKRNI